MLPQLGYKQILHRCGNPYFGLLSLNWYGLLLSRNLDDKTCSLRFKTEHKITHTVSGCQLSENHTQHLISTSECSDFLIPRVLLYQVVKDTPRKKICKLSENIFTLIHCFELLDKAKKLFNSNCHARKRYITMRLSKISKNDFLYKMPTSVNTIINIYR